jgi:uncharacterized protein
MGQEVVSRTAGWLKELAVKNGGPAGREALEVTFHGGEPLLAGADFYREALPRLQDGWSGRPVRFAVQSNLWRLDDAMLDVFSGYPLALGTSLDGPEDINDSQRGEGYFRQTMHGIERARKAGVPVGCIATFTAQSAPRWREVVEFFIVEGLSFSVHAALPVLGRLPEQPWQLSPQAYGDLLVDLLDYYLDNLKRTRIDTLDALIRSVSSGKGGMCTFGNCLGSYMAVGPDGSVYPCQRFTGDERFRLGSVADHPDSLRESTVWSEFSRRQEQIDSACAGCEFLDICRGGCPYNVLAAGGQSSFDGHLRDPYCAAYRRIFSEITDRAADEAFAPDNLAEVIAQPDPDRGMLRKGRILELMSKRPHPFETARNARQALAAVALAATVTPEEAAARLADAGLVGRADKTLEALAGMQGRFASGKTLRNNLYLHVTYDCVLHCSHCYAEGGTKRKGSFPVSELKPVSMEAARLGFRHLVVTGGEPLVHPERKELLRVLAAMREQVQPLRSVLRTSLALPVDEELLELVANCTDEVVVSVDGDPVTHDQRRGAGSYATTISNLRELLGIKGSAEISLAAVLPLEEAQGQAGRHVRALAEDLGIRRVRFRPVLPLGRAARCMPDLKPEVVWAALRPEERVAYGFQPAASCGMGQNLYIEPDGAAYPCYAWHGDAWNLGNILDDGGLAGVVMNEGFQRLGCATVDTNRGCRECTLRYLCGGACRAWSRQPVETQTDLDAPPVECKGLYARALGVLTSAMAFLEVSRERWEGAGLPPLGGMDR